MLEVPSCSTLSSLKMTTRKGNDAIRVRASSTREMKERTKVSNVTDEEIGYGIFIHLPVLCRNRQSRRLPHSTSWQPANGPKQHPPQQSLTRWGTIVRMEVLTTYQFHRAASQKKEYPVTAAALCVVSPESFLFCWSLGYWLNVIHMQMLVKGTERSTAQMTRLVRISSGLQEILADLRRYPTRSQLGRCPR